jgi:hypothetical protein
MKPLADISGDNAAHFLTTDATLEATAVYLGAVAGPMRVGDSTVSSTKGVQVATGGLLVMPPKRPDQGGYKLSRIKVYVPTGTTLTISYDSD